MSNARTSLGCCADERGIAGACFSGDRRRRFLLWRNWDWSKPIMTACMLNPSIADEQDLDPTLRRVQRYAMDWGFGGMYIVNAFALVATNPIELRGSFILHDAVNDAHIVHAAKNSRLVMVGWGTNMDRPTLAPRRRELHRLLTYAKEVKAWDLTGTGQPKHPLYLPADIEPVSYGVIE